MVLTRADKSRILQGLYMRVSFIETGDPCMRASDARRAGMGHKIQILSPEQHAEIAEHERLISMIMSERVD